jgi:hypothetical protein
MSANVSIPRIRTTMCLRSWVLLFEGRVNSPLRQTEHTYFILA